MRKTLFCLLFIGFAQISFGQTQIDMAKAFPCNGCLGYSNPNANLDALRPVEYNRLQEIFKEISKDSEIEFHYPQAGCQQRTQFLSMLLTKKYHLDHFRVWLFAPVNLDKVAKAQLEIKDINGLSEDGLIKWNYHVAPAVKIKDKVFVIDPSLDREKPMILADWLKSIGNSNLSKYSFISSEYYFFYRQYDSSNNLTNVINGNFFTYGDTSRKSLHVEIGLAVNDVAMSIYRKHILPLQASNAEADREKFKRLREVFGNYNNLHTFLAQDLEMNRQFGTTTNRELYANYGDIVVEARRLYLERTLFWMKKTDELLK